MSVRTAWIAGVLAIAFVGAGVGWMAGGSSPYVVEAEFTDLGGLRKNSDVKIGGIPVGKITSIGLTGEDRARVKLELDSDAGGVGQGASARSRPASVFGDKYVDLQPGDMKRPLKSGATIPVARTSTAVELDDVFDILSPDVRTRLRLLLHESGMALTGRGDDFQQLLSALPPGLDEARKLLAELSDDNAKLAGLVRRGDRVLGAVARNRGDAADLVSTGARAFKTLASRRSQLGQTLDEAPGGLRQLRITLAELDGVTRQLRPAAADLARAAPPLTAVLRELPPFADDVGPALGSLRRSAPALNRLATDGAPELRRLLPFASSLKRFSASAKPVSGILDRQVAGILGTMEGWVDATQNRDGLGHYFHGDFLFDRDFADSITAAYLRPGAGSTNRRAGREPRPRPASPPVDSKPESKPAPSLPRSTARRPPTSSKPPATELRGGQKDLGLLLDYLLAP